MNREDYTGLYTSYLQMYNEAVRADRAGRAKGKMGTGDGDPMASKAVGGGGSGNKGGMTLTPVTGLGRGYKGDKDKVAKTYKKVKEQDKANDRGISSSDRKERARQNKENTAKKGIDNILKDIRGK